MPTDHTQDPMTLDALLRRCLDDLTRRLEHTATLTAEAVHAAAEAVRSSLSNAPGIRQEDLQAVLETIVRNWQQVLDQVHRRGTPLPADATLPDWTTHGLSLLAQLAGTVKTLAGEVESRLQRELESHTGSVVSAGHFFCTQCGKEIQMVKTAPLPPCSRCHGTVFRRRP